MATRASDRLGTKLRFGAIVLLFAAIVTVALQNLAVVDLQLFGWSFQARRIALIFGSFLIGVLAGWLLRGKR